MKLKFFILYIMFIMISILPALTTAGYRELKNEFENYRPPIPVENRDAKKEPVEKIARKESKEKAERAFSGEAGLDFKEQKQKMEQIKSRWQRTLEEKQKPGLFYRPGKNLLKQLKPAATDTFQAVRHMKKEYSLETLSTLVLLRNPDIDASEKRFKAAIETFSQVANLDSILRQYTAFTEDLMTGVGSMKGKEPVAIRFPFPGVLALKAQVVQQDVKSTWEDLAKTRRNILTETKKYYWELIYNGEARRITRETIRLFDHLEEVAITRYEAGRTSFQDTLKIRITRETLRENINTLEEKQHNLVTKILELTNLPQDSPVGKPLEITIRRKLPTLGSLNKAALKNRQELRKLKAGIGKTERMIEMAETMILPSYTLGFSFYDDEAVNMTTADGKQGGFSVKTKASRKAGLPKMPWYGSEDAYIRQMRQKLNALRKELENAEKNTITLVRTRWFALDRANRERNLYKETVVELSRSALTASTRGYEAGGVSFADVIDSYKLWLNAHLTLERKQADVGISWAELEQAVGKSFGSL